MAITDEKNYITPEGYAALKAEFHQLYRAERPNVVRDVSWAAGNGDRSENGDYIYGKRRLRQIDSRCRHLMRRMDLAEIVDPADQQELERVFFGAWVTLYSLEHDTEHHYRIVGKDELAPTKGYISWISPLAQSMLGKQIGDIIHVVTNTKNENEKGEENKVSEESYEIIEISYHTPKDDSRDGA